MGRVGIVCDSTCDLGLPWFEEHDVTMVPLKVMFGEESFLDWVDLDPKGFYERLASADALPTTSQPSPAQFAEAYERLASDGCDEIVSIHLTSPLSGTYESATMAAAEASVPVRVVDTLLVTHATGLAIEAAVEARDAGGTGEEVATVATDTARATQLFFVLDTLEYLVKGGRAGKAAGLAASVLSIKPVLFFNDEGTIEPFEKVRGTKKAIATLVNHVAETADGRRIRLAVFHAVDEQLAQQLIDALDEAGVDYELDSVGSIGAVIGTYAGPGSVGLAFYPLS